VCSSDIGPGTSSIAATCAASITTHPWMRPAAVRVRVAHLTDVGLVRERNEDAVHVDPRGQFFIVADGMGGHAAGDVASRLAVDVVRERLEAARRRFDASLGSRDGGGAAGLKPLLSSAVRAAHAAIRGRAAADPTLSGMGTTIEVVLVLGNRALIAHAGDSRTYLVRGRSTTQLTRDHTMAELAVLAGTLTAEEAPDSPLSSMLSNAVGALPHVTVDIIDRTLRPGDRLLLCTDGLYDGLAPESVGATVSAGSPERALGVLVALARSRGGHDNISGVIVEMPGVASLAWDDEPTVPRATPRVLTPARGTPSPDVLPANPLAYVPDEALCGIVEQGIHEETGPVVSVS